MQDECGGGETLSSKATQFVIFMIITIFPTHRAIGYPFALVAKDFALLLALLM